MGLQSLFFIGAFIPPVALIYGIQSYRYRNRDAVHAGSEIVSERYRGDEA